MHRDAPPHAPPAKKIGIATPDTAYQRLCEKDDYAMYGRAHAPARLDADPAPVARSGSWSGRCRT